MGGQPWPTTRLSSISTLSGIDGLEVRRRLRRKCLRAPIPLLIALEAVLDRGTERGARTAGYLVNPFTLVKLANPPRALIQTAGGRTRST